MNFAKCLTTAFGLAAVLAVSAPASAANYTYNLVGDTSTAYTDPAWPGWTYVDTADPATHATEFPDFSLHANDTIQVTLTLNNPATFNALDIFLYQVSDPTAWIDYDQTISFSLGGVAVPNPITGYWDGSSSVRRGLGFAAGFDPDPGSLTFDKVIVNAVITGLRDSLGGSLTSLELLHAPTSVGFYNPAVAATPIPGGLLLMTTALGGLGLVARRKRAASASV